MNKRLKKKMFKKQCKINGRHSLCCVYCGKRQDFGNKYFLKYGTCDSTCYMYLIGMSWEDFL